MLFLPQVRHKKIYVSRIFRAPGTRLTVLYEREDRKPDEIVRNLVQIDQEPTEDNERHQDLPVAVEEAMRTR